MYNSKDVLFDPEQFYGFRLSEEQINFANAICNPDNLCVLCNSPAGTGKTLVALGTANLLVQKGLYDKIYYIVSPTQEQIQGYIPGTQEEKSKVYSEPLEQALVSLGINPNVAIASDSNIMNLKSGRAYIYFMTHTYLRGTNLEKSVIILDETQNFIVSDLKKVLTRIHDSCKTIVIGHSGQIDIIKRPERSGFERMIELFQTDGADFTEVVELKENHRGRVSLLADKL